MATSLNSSYGRQAWRGFVGRPVYSTIEAGATPKDSSPNRIGKASRFIDLAFGPAPGFAGRVSAAFQSRHSAPFREDCYWHVKKRFQSAPYLAERRGFPYVGHDFQYWKTNATCSSD
jgi:hypothetical protein